MFVMSHIVNEFDRSVKPIKPVLDETESFVEDKEYFRKLKIFYI